MMKSNEEFIAGIYEKAAVYTEVKKKKAGRWYQTARGVQMAAMAVLCISLAGAGTLLYGRWGQDEVLHQQTQEDGIALLSETMPDQADAGYQSRRMTEPEWVTYTGKVMEIDTEEKRIWMMSDTEDGDILCIKWDSQEEICEEIKKGVRLTVTGLLSLYENETSVHNGCRELILTDTADVWIKEERE